MLYLKLLEKQEQAKPKTSRRREIIKIRAKISLSGLEYRKTIPFIIASKRNQIPRSKLNKRCE
jgi:hypothetical protein